MILTREKILSLTDNEINDYFNYNVDWTKEPTESLKELMRQQAQLIRDKYSYIVLYFSGGSDSTTMLNAFLDNDIFVDEVVTIIFDGVNLPCFDGKFATEYLKQKNYRGKFSLVSIKYDDVIRFIKSENSLIDWMQNFSGAIHQLSRSSIEGLEKYGFSKPIFRNGNIIHVYGIEIPHVVKIDQNYYVVHNMISEPFFNGIMYEHNNFKFFNNREFPKLYVKQAHILARTMKKMNLDVLPTDIAAKTIRDVYNTDISPQKSNILTLIKTPDQKTEINMLVSYYQKSTKNFKDIYFNSVVLYQAKNQQIFKTKCMINTKYSLLF